MSRRSRAREVVLQLLYRDDLNGQGDPHGDLAFLNGRLQSDARLVAFAMQLLSGVREHRSAIDDHLSQAAQNWRLQRMAATDRNILRLGVYELLYSDTPPPVAINEAVELAKRYGDRNSPKFVNGVLDRLHRERDEAAADSDSPGPSAPPRALPHDSAGDVR